MQIHFPLFLRARDSGEIASIKSVADLQAYVERIDIENGEYEAWDKDGLPVDLQVQEPIWIRLEPSAERHDPEQLRRALLQFAEKEGVRIAEQLPTEAFEEALGQIRAEQERKMLRRSCIRRRFSRSKQARKG